MHVERTARMRGRLGRVAARQRNRVLLTQVRELLSAVGETLSVVVGDEATPAPHLTPREWQVAALLAAGMTNQQIAERLVIGERTAESHVEHLRRKLGLSNRTQVGSWLMATRTQVATREAREAILAAVAGQTHSAAAGRRLPSSRHSSRQPDRST